MFIEIIFFPTILKSVVYFPTPAPSKRYMLLLFIYKRAAKPVPLAVPYGLSLNPCSAAPGGTSGPGRRKGPCDGER